VVQPWVLVQFMVQCLPVIIGGHGSLAVKEYGRVINQLIHVIIQLYGEHGEDGENAIRPEVDGERPLVSLNRVVLHFVNFNLWKR